MGDHLEPGDPVSGTFGGDCSPDPDRRDDGSAGRSRRSVLRRGGLAAALGLVGVAGCLAPGRPDRGVEGLPDYARWLPSAGALGIGDGYYSFSHLDVGAVVENRERFDASEYRSFADPFEGEGSILPPVEQVSGGVLAYASADGSSLLVVEGSFTAEVAAERLRAAGFESSLNRGGFDLHEGPDGTLGVKDGIVAGAISPRDRHPEFARAVLDAGQGTARRLVDADEDARGLVAALGDRLNALGLLTPGNLEAGYGPDGLSVAGRSVRLDAAGATVELVFVYDDPDGVDLASIQETAVGRDNALTGTREVSASADGRVARVSGRTDVEGLLLDGLSVRVG